ncbi:chorismate synthase [Candidatus Woesearchaeota archaeon]|nr:chorismate synthase [Candidatus Woesearchaeota archaeon]
MTSTFGRMFRISTWGESHGKGVGVVIDGCPPNLEVSEEDIQKDLDRRRPGQSAVTTPRKEADKAIIMSGVFEGRTTGAPISIMVMNEDIDSAKYEKFRELYRPGHADYTYEKKYGIRDWRGGGRSSAREQVGRVAAAAIAKKVLEKEGISVIGFTRQVGRIRLEDSEIDYSETEKNPVRAAHRKKALEMEKLILAAKAEGDSVGGIVEVVAKGVPAGLGEPTFDKLSADLAKAVMSIGAVKGIEIGDGFRLAEMKGSEANDAIKKSGFSTNHAGGILGGISSGQDIIVRAAVKPTSSIAKEQQTISRAGREEKLKAEGRFDPCLCPRAVPVVEAMVALVLVDHLLRQRAYG